MMMAMPAMTMPAMEDAVLRPGHDWSYTPHAGGSVLDAAPVQGAAPDFCSAPARLLDAACRPCSPGSRRDTHAQVALHARHVAASRYCLVIAYALQPRS